MILLIAYCYPRESHQSLFRQNLSIGQMLMLLVALSPKNLSVRMKHCNVIREAHSSISHGGRVKTVFELNSHYSWIPRFAVETYLKQCITCQIRKPFKQHLLNKPIIYLGVMARLQVDLVDMRTRPDSLNPDVTYNWILNCIDHFSKGRGTICPQNGPKC